MQTPNDDEAAPKFGGFYRLPTPAKATIALLTTLYAFFSLAVRGSGVIFLVLWIASILFTASIYWRRSASLRSLINSREVLTAAIITVAVAPLFIVGLYLHPFRIGTDEIVDTLNARTALGLHGEYLFGYRTSTQQPEITHKLLGGLGELVGGVSIVSMRLVHGSFGILCALFSYVFFRQFCPRGMAVMASLLFATNHTLIGLSRMAMNTNLPLLSELVFLSLFFLALRRSTDMAFFVSGLALGGSFYFYTSARFVPIAWLLCVATLWLTRTQTLRQILRYAIPTAIGALLIATPVLIGVRQAGSERFGYQHQQLLLFKEGRQLQMAWEYEPSESTAWLRNIQRGALTFNTPLRDRGNQYINKGHGILDPATGILLWIGIVAVARDWLKRKAAHPAELLCVLCFLFLWVVASILVTKAPNYTRLLVILPFVTYCATRGLKELAALVTSRDAAKANAVALIALGLIVAANLLIYRSYLVESKRKGDAVGGTGRFIASRADLLGHRYYILADDDHPYYSWGGETAWRYWAGFFISKHQSVMALRPSAAATIFQADPFSFTVFLNRSALPQLARAMRSTPFITKVHNITPDGRLVAVEAIPSTGAIDSVLPRTEVLP